MRHGWMCAGALCVAGVGARAQDSPADLAELIESVRGSIVLVEHALRYDNGEAPEVEYMGQPYQQAQGDIETAWSTLIKQQRPDVRAGFVIAPDLVVVNDPLVHPRFVESIGVRVGDDLIPASVEALAAEQNALILRLDEPLENEMLSFDAAAAGPYTALWSRFGNGKWWVGGTSIEGSVRADMDGLMRHGVMWPSVVVGGDGTPVSMTFDGSLEHDGSWRVAPSEWDWVSAPDMTTTAADIAARADAGLPRVELRFRSPTQSSAAAMAMGGVEGDVTEWHGTGVLIDERRVLVLARLDPKVTGRLDSIRVHLADGRAVDAEFVGSLRDHGAFIAELADSAAGALSIADVGFLDVEDRLLMRAEVRVLGETRTSYVWHARLPRTTVGFRGELYPVFGTVSSSDFGTGDGSEVTPTFVFSLEGDLVALPLARRDSVSSRDDWQGWSRADYESTVATGSLLRRVLDAGADAIDPENRPLTEAEEQRLAWLGVELQAMDPDLARFNGVADLTGGGMTGGIVTYVYEDSPASRAGLEVGDVLLRLHVEGEPRPIEVQVSPYDMGWGAQFSEVLDRVDVAMFEQAPVPWGGAETALTRALTDVGFGTPFVMDVFRGGEVMRPEFAVEQGPAHFHAAAKYRNEDAGLTVRDLTYEVRRFFQLMPEDPGVIVSRVEPGSRVAVAGLKPYELIVSVNDEPLRSVDDFEAAVRAGGELRLSVKRMHVGRIVKIVMPGG